MKKMYFLLKNLILTISWFNLNLAEEYFSTVTGDWSTTYFPETPEIPKMQAKNYQEKLNELWEKQRAFSIKTKLQDSEIRRHYIVIYGLVEEQEENTLNKVFTFLCANFQSVPIIQQYEIDEVMRLGKKSFRMVKEKRDALTPRPILVRFTTQLLAIDLIRRSEEILKYTKYGILNFKDLDDVFDKNRLHKFLREQALIQTQIIGHKAYLEGRYYYLHELKKKVLTAKYGETYYNVMLKDPNKYNNGRHKYYPNRDGKYERIINRNRNDYRAGNHQRHFGPDEQSNNYNKPPMPNHRYHEKTEDKENENDFQQNGPQKTDEFDELDKYKCDSPSGTLSDEDDESVRVTRPKIKEEIREEALVDQFDIV